MKKFLRVKTIAIATLTALSSSSFATTTSHNNLLLAFGWYKTKSVAPQAMPLLAVNNTQGDNWSYPSIKLSKEYTDYGTLFSGSCSNDFCISSGYQIPDTMPQKLFIISSQDQGKSWSDRNIIPEDMIKDYSKAASGCSDDFCVIVSGFQTKDGRNLPLLTVSNNKGESWFFPEAITKNLPHDYISSAGFDSVGCNNKLCIAAGVYDTSEQKSRPLIARSIDKGVTWSYSSQIELPPLYEGYIRPNMTVSCSDKLCAISTNHITDRNSMGRPAVFVSSDEGKSWLSRLQMPNENGIRFADISHIHCQGNSCITVGAYENIFGEEKLLLAVTKNNGNSWFYPPSITSELPKNIIKSEFNSVSCNSHVCVAIGNTMNIHQDDIIIIATSYDEGKTWSYVNPERKFHYVYMDGISCNEKICFAVGDYLPGPVNPYLISSQDNGKTWIESSSVLSGLPADFKEGGFIETHTTTRKKSQKRS